MLMNQIRTIVMNRQVQEFWQDELQMPLPGFNLYTDYAKRSGPCAEHGVVYPLEFTLPQTRQWTSLSIGDQQAWMLTCYIILLVRMTGEPDQLIGIPSYHGDILPLRITCEPDQSLQQLHELIKKKLLLINASSLPLREIEELVNQREIIQATFGQVETSTAYCLNWGVQRDNDRLKLFIKYDRYLFKEKTIRRLAAHFECIAGMALENREVAIGRISILTDEDRKAYESLNNTHREWDTPPNGIAGMFRRSVEQFPDRIALSATGQSLTYRQLDFISGRVARKLRECGLSKGDFVSIYMERSIDAIISMLAIIKAGGAYIPLDPEHPDDRNAYIISDTASPVVITKEVYRSKLATLSAGMEQVSFLYLDSELMDKLDSAAHKERYGEIDDADDIVEIAPHDIAYIIYTSGTTGRPKGVLIPHAGVVNLAMSTVDHLQFTEQDIIVQYSTFSFDASVYDIFSALCCGAELHLLSGEQRYSVESFTSVIEQVKATRVGILPTVFFNQLSAYLSTEDACKYGLIQSFVIGGEALSGEAVRELQRKLPHCPMIVNAYGPTEVTVVTTTHTIDRPISDDITAVSIGKPISNYEVLIVNDHDQLCPLDVAGELLIHSVGLAHGYLNQPEKTEEVFITDPIHPTSGKRYYRSGDLVRLTHSGIEYIGRKDLQVKIRGYRIELGEIEENLAKHEQIKDVAIIIKTNSDGEKTMAAFYTSKKGEPLNKSELTSFLKAKVPVYMVPSHFIFIESMPLSPTGKMDRKRLDLYEIPVEDEVCSTYVAPENDIQQTIVKAWEQVLRRKSIGIHDDFFEIGGHSLKIIEILVLLKPSYPRLKINDFFVHSTVSRLAQRISVLNEEDVSGMLSTDSFKGISDLEEYPRRFVSNVPGLREAACSKQEHILLTGATGYLGSSLLYELLQSSRSNIYCLVRPVAGITGCQRLAEVMHSYYGELIAAKMAGRVTVVEGNLEEPHLGLNSADRELLRKVDSIIHCGAEVKHYGDADYFTRVNVESTDRLLDLARDTGGNVRFHHISTIGIPEDLAFNGQWDRFISGAGYTEDIFTDNVYTNSKLEAEKRVARACAEEGVPSTIYRIGNLSCHSKTGRFQQNIDNNAFYRMLKAMLMLGKAPRVRWYVDITPIDYAGKAVVALALQAHTAGALFHVCNPSQIGYDDMIQSIQDYGYRIELLDWPDYESWVLDHRQPKDRTGLELAMAQLEGDGAKNSAFRFTCPHTLEFLADSNVQCQVPDKAFFERMLDYAVSIEYFPKP